MRPPALALRALVAAAAVVAIGCSAPASRDADADGGGRAAYADASGDPAYPALYRDMQLPQPPGAQVMSTGRQEVSLDDGLSIRVTTDMTVQAARAYFSQVLADQGWDEMPARVLPGIPVANLTATRDGVTYTATFTSNGDATGVDINVVRN
jgi:hypothetical protein